MANIEKSYIFKILSNRGVPTLNIPLCNIDYNTALISVKDNRLKALVKIYNPQKVDEAILRIVVIAGLIKEDPQRDLELIKSF